MKNMYALLVMILALAACAPRGQAGEAPQSEPTSKSAPEGTEYPDMLFTTAVCAGVGYQAAMETNTGKIWILRGTWYPAPQGCTIRMR